MRGDAGVFACFCFCAGLVEGLGLCLMGVGVMGFAYRCLRCRRICEGPPRRL